jgi:hypothetical protein
MPDQATLMNRFQELEQQTKLAAEEYSGVLGSVKGLIVEHFGQNGLYAAYIVITVLVLVLVSRLGRITFSTLKYLVIPALALAFVGSIVSSYTFIGLLPVTVTGCSLVLLFKG